MRLPYWPDSRQYYACLRDLPWPVWLDSGFPNLGEMVIPSSELAIGEWKTYSIKFDMLLENPGFVDQGGEGVDLENVLNPFVIEVQDGAAEVYLDNISVTNACKVVGGCGADPRTKGLPDVVVYDDAVNTDVWGRGIVGSDSGTGYVDYSDGTDPANKDLYEKDLKGAILCTSQCIGSTMGAGTVMMLSELGVQPQAWLFSSHIDSISAGGLIIDDVWNGRRVITIDLLGDEFLEAVKTGDPIAIHEDGTVEVG